MRSAGESGRANETDGLALGDPGARTYAAREPAQMTVAGRDSVAMAQLNEVAVAAAPASSLHHPVTGRHHRGSRRGRVVGSLVPTGYAQDRMKPRSGKGGGD